MPRSKKNLEKFLSLIVHNPPEIFHYESDGYIIMVDVLEGEISVKPSMARMLRSNEVEIIKSWTKVSNLPGSWSDWTNYVRPIITYYYIDAKTRKNLFKIFRESTQSKLNNSIREVKKLLKYTEIKWEHLIREREFLRSRLNGNISLAEKLKTQKTGCNKFLYPIIRPLFEKLESLDYTKEEQCKIVCKLYEIGNFDNFDDTIEEYDDGYKEMNNALNRIRQIRIESFEDTFL